MTRPARQAMHPGDVGRRVRHLREQRGLSRAELAARAGTIEEFVADVEDRPVHLDVGQLLRLAEALGVPESTLAGADVDIAPGQGEAARRPAFHVLEESECWDLLGRRGVGRIALVIGSDPSPVVVPLNYAVAERTLLMRTESGTVVDLAIEESGGQCPASFEVDRIDDPQRQGWSVLVRGVATTRALGLDEDIDVDPWPGGRRGMLVRIEPQHVTGRRIDVG